jgi:thiosulfate/3-mercaptopyruvate sulfurtransferase
MISVTAFGFVARSSALDVQTQMLATTEWLAKNLDNPNLVILHVADNRENYDKGHIPGAQFLAWDEIAVSRDGSWHQLPSLEEENYA